MSKVRDVDMGKWAVKSVFVTEIRHMRMGESMVKQLRTVDDGNYNPVTDHEQRRGIHFGPPLR